MVIASATDMGKIIRVHFALEDEASVMNGSGFISKPCEGIP